MRVLNLDYAKFKEDPAAYFGQEVFLPEVPPLTHKPTAGSDMYLAKGIALVLRSGEGLLTANMDENKDPRAYLLVADKMIELKDKYTECMLLGTAAEAALVAQKRGLKMELTIVKRDGVTLYTGFKLEN